MSLQTRSDPDFPPSWEERNRAVLDDARARRGLKVLWISTGEGDRGVERTRKSVEVFEQHGFAPVYKESAGGHWWSNWRTYRTEYAGLLFKPRKRS